MAFIAHKSGLREHCSGGRQSGRAENQLIDPYNETITTDDHSSQDRGYHYGYKKEYCEFVLLVIAHDPAAIHAELRSYIFTESAVVYNPNSKENLEKRRRFDVPAELLSRTSLRFRRLTGIPKRI
jgi:hypothetical protein